MTHPMTHITPDEAEAVVALVKRLREKKAAVGFYSPEPNVIATKYGDDPLTTEAAAMIAALADLRKADRAEIERLRELNYKYLWQVRDTCTRAEKAEAELRQCRMQALADAAQDQMRAEAIEADRVKVAETALRMAADLPSYDSDGDPAGQFDHHIFVKRNAILVITPAAVIAQADAATCRKCGGEMRPGIAMGQTYTAGAPDFPGDDNHGQTMSAGGPGAVIAVLKCAACGWSVTKDLSHD